MTASSTLAVALLVVGLGVGIVVGAGAYHVANPSSTVTETSTSTQILTTTEVATTTQYATQTTTSISTAVSVQFQTTTQTVTNTQYQTLTSTVTTTSVSYVEITGSQVLLSSATEVIPNGQKSIALPTWSFPYNGYLQINYTATQSVSISYNAGSTTIASPNSETGSELLFPLTAGTPQVSVLNGACTILGCPSITMTISVTYYY